MSVIMEEKVKVDKFNGEMNGNGKEHDHKATYQSVRNIVKEACTDLSIEQSLSEILSDAFEAVIEKAQLENKSLKYAAYKLGIERILKATQIKS